MLFFELFPAFMAVVSMGAFIFLVVLDRQGRREAHARRESLAAPDTASATSSAAIQARPRAVSRSDSW